MVRGPIHHFLRDGDASILTAALWEARGPSAGNLVLANDSNGYLQITASALAERSYVRLIANPPMLDGTLRVQMLIEGWDAVTTIYPAGPGVRMSWTSGNNMSGYGCIIGRDGALSTKAFRWRMRELVTGVNTGIGVQSTAVSGGLIGVWSDMRLSVMSDGANADISCDCRREGQATSEYADVVQDDASPRVGSDCGIWINYLPTTHAIRVKLIEVS